MNAELRECGGAAAERASTEPQETGGEGRAIGSGHPKLGIGVQLCVVILGVSLLPLLASNWLGYAGARAALLEEAAQTLRLVALVKETQILGFLAERKRAFESIGPHAPEIAEMLAVATDPESPAAEHVRAESSLRQWLRERREEEASSGIELLDLAGRTVASDGAAEVPHPWPQSPFLTAGRSGFAFEYFPSLAKRDRGFVMAAVQPARDGSGRAVGEIVSVYGMGGIHGVLTDLGEVPGRVEIFLVARDGGHLCDSKLEVGPAAEPSLPTSERRAAFLQPDRAIVHTGEHGRVLALLHPLDGMMAGLLVETPTEAALAPIESLRSRAFRVAGVFALSLVVLSVVLSRWVTRPLRTLAEAARSLGGGDDASIPVPRRGDEIGVLAAEFARMRESIGAARGRLEGLVHERTRDLEQSHRFVALLLDTLPEIIVVVDRQGTITLANRTARRIFGEGIVGRICEEVFHGCARRFGQCPCAKTFETGSAACFEWPEPDPETGEILSVDTVPLRDEEGNVDAVVFSGRLVTASRRLEAELLHRERMSAVGQLAAGVAHEIGNPLAAILSLVQGLQRRVADPAVVSDLQAIRDQMARVSASLRELTGAARLSKRERGIVLVNEVARRACRLVGYDPRMRTLRFSLEADPDVPPAWAVEDWILQVLLNLLLNALDALEGGGEGVLRVSTSRGADGGIVLAVEDSGLGMDPAVREKLFEPFFTTKPIGKGTGLGLYLSRELVQAMNGRIEAESRRGQGSRFTVWLPGADRES